MADPALIAAIESQGAYETHNHNERTSSSSTPYIPARATWPAPFRKNHNVEENDDQTSSSSPYIPARANWPAPLRITKPSVAKIATSPPPTTTSGTATPPPNYNYNYTTTSPSSEPRGVSAPRRVKPRDSTAIEMEDVTPSTLSRTPGVTPNTNANANANVNGVRVRVRTISAGELESQQQMDRRFGCCAASLVLIFLVVVIATLGCVLVTLLVTDD